MSDQPILPGMHSATSSLALASGLTPYGAPAGPTTAPCGLDPALASLSARQAKERGLLTSGTYGRRGTGSSDSADLMSSLVSRLKARSSMAGSTLFNLTWKEKVTPSGRSVYLLRASVRRTAGLGFTSWRSPAAGDSIRGVHPNPDARAGRHSLNNEAALSGWPTPDTRPDAPNSGTNRGKNWGGERPRLTVQGLGNAAQLATWPTPRTPTGGPESGERKQELGRTESGGGDLQAVALMASWATPSSRDWKDTPGMSETGTNPDGSSRTRLDQLPRQVQLTVSGGGQSGFPAEMEKPGQLNPAHSRWLMGLPPVWDDCICTAIASLPRSRKRS